MRRWIVLTLGAAAGLTLAVVAVPLYIVHEDRVERPSDQSIIQAFREHKPQFESLNCKARNDENQRRLKGTGGEWIFACDYDGSFRAFFGGSRLGMATGPGWVKGVTYLTGDITRKGTLVASTDHAYRLPADVYLMPIEGRWYVFYQRDD